jgi:hypothetical protein
MLSRTLAALVAVSAAAFAVGALAACPPRAAEEALPPAGLAGSPGGASLALPGAGLPVPSPTGTATPGTALPPGHPPIDGMAPAAAIDPGLPAGHPPVDGAAGAPPAGPAAPAGGQALPPALTGQNLGPSGQPAQEPVLTGSVLESIDVPEYTYMRLKTSGGEAWVAVNKTPVSKGDLVTVNQSMVMEGFHSKTLDRTFDKVVFGTLVGAPRKP